MPNLVKVVAQLRKQRDEAQRQVEQLEQALSALGSLDGLRSRGRSTHAVGTKGRTMSAAARKRIAAAQRARWAKWKAAQKKK
jgi:predicted RNase H-like nuclease (RuvC/YqgF family)